MPRRVQNFGNIVFSDEDEDNEEYDMTKDNEDNEDSEDSEDIEDSEEEGNEQRSLLGEAEETVQQDKEYVGGEDEEAGHQDVGEAEETVQQHKEDVGGEDETGQQDEEEETAQQDKTGKEVETLEKTYPCNECSSIFFPLPLQLRIKNNHSLFHAVYLCNICMVSYCVVSEAALLIATILIHCPCRRISPRVSLFGAPSDGLSAL